MFCVPSPLDFALILERAEFGEIFVNLGKIVYDRIFIFKAAARLNNI
jgi:hypothetical protein